jgi:hypothetical protein
VCSVVRNSALAAVCSVVRNSAVAAVLFYLKGQCFSNSFLSEGTVL